MINFPIRRAVLAVLAVAALSLPVAAQTDAAFAAALGKIPSGMATLAQLKTTPQKPAAAQGPAAPAAVWQKVFHTVLRYGTRSAVPGTLGFSYLLKETFTTPDDHHISQSVNFLGVPAADGTVGVVAALFIATERYYDPNTNEGRIESSVFEADGAGKLKSAFHRTTIMTASGTTAGAPVNLDLAAPATSDEFSAFLEWWSKN
ncbi:MAG: hypothetical protein COV48_07805 [Elusimicrobia bacterium CG11_big_fil_rev_8_21_14_0_20_64_6]|nr:MAG: hypothetical protein COV48_07805 [Elusimicrobia bacterium CG11_big_fil_rev_8_21_14_0_20_64_6]